MRERFLEKLVVRVLYGFFTHRIIETFPAQTYSTIDSRSALEVPPKKFLGGEGRGKAAKTGTERVLVLRSLLAK
jgi:hypothetical protein